jgi:hypothetical protein
LQVRKARPLETTMTDDVPTLAEFLQSCRDEFRFAVEEFGFAEAPCSNPKESFCFRLEKNDRSMEIRGEGWGTTAACHLSCGTRGPLALVYMIPDAARPKRSRTRDRMGQIDRIRELAGLARAHASDFLTGDIARFTRVWEDRQRSTRLRNT